MKRWDIIGDIHGQLAKLEELLARLGYAKSAGAYRHPERRVLFLGDYIDRGPDIRGVLHTVRAMVDAGEAVALMGNHELNALHYHTRGLDGRPLRSNEGSKGHQHAATLEQFAGREAEWQEWLGWFAQLPLFHESEDFRAIHACWSDTHLEDIRGADLRNLEFLVASSDTSRAEGRAMQILLKGPELDLPAGVVLSDKDGHTRDTIRVRWWDLEDGELSYGSLVMPPGGNAPEHVAQPTDLAGFPSYPRDERPVFCGHYWMPYTGRIDPLAENVMCLDYSAGKDGPLVACRWNGALGESEFVATPGDVDSPRNS
jgi:hypothetical protein